MLSFIAGVLEKISVSLAFKFVSAVKTKRNERLIYRSVGKNIGHDFRSFESKEYIQDGNGNYIPVGDAGKGMLSFGKNLLTVYRTNTAGRF
jgi:hypothetical protein